ncbi:transcription initiation factor TFIID subunit 7 [Carex littledalei]|uniref:Transcription initiation factor TFIID subunit 7 n=1 Tax=Carex littledalei TaxID=544730 RepID=A0A833VC49_9POAL|nr:transcription initiation factor TFIID subunit 7 [Carex littledalei]
MELQSEDNGEKISIDHTTITLGRSNVSSNPTVSRRHVSLKLTPESTLTFEVLGKNPILILTNGCKKVCRRGEKGELREGDRLSLSIQRPSLWVVKTLKREVERSILEAVKRRERKTMERRREREERETEELREEVGEHEEFEVESLNLSNIDPVEEFGFLVTGHEFDKYSKGTIRPMKNWNWYLDTPKENSDSENEKDDFTDEASTSKNKNGRAGKKRGKEEGDEDWTVVSEEEKDLIAKDASSLKGSKYTTRSKDLKKPRKETVKDEDDSTVQNEEVDDETLGGFIVTGEEEEEEMDNRELEEEEEEFVDYND